MRDFDRAIALQPRCGKGLAYLWRGEARLRIGRASGKQDLRSALAIHPNFAQARRWGYDRVRLEHLSFGSILGKDGKPLKTRDGDPTPLITDDCIKP